jgi:hypothetical protein
MECCGSFYLYYLNLSHIEARGSFPCYANYIDDIEDDSGWEGQRIIILLFPPRGQTPY